MPIGAAPAGLDKVLSWRQWAIAFLTRIGRIARVGHFGDGLANRTSIDDRDAVEVDERAVVTIASIDLQCVPVDHANAVLNVDRILAISRCYGDVNIVRRADQLNDIARGARVPEGDRQSHILVRLSIRLRRRLSHNHIDRPQRVLGHGDRCQRAREWVIPKQRPVDVDGVNPCIRRFGEQFPECLLSESQASAERARCIDNVDNIGATLTVDQDWNPSLARIGAYELRRTDILLEAIHRRSAG